MKKLNKVAKLGQSIWLDYIRRSLLTSGGLQDWIDKGLRGMTSNPKIFNKAIVEGDEYDDQIRSLAEADKSPHEIYEALAIQDIQHAADLFHPVWEESGGFDGYVSLEANPHLAYDTDGTIKEIRRLCRLVDRPNVMFKVPATPEGIPAVERLVAEGININITLMFSMHHFEAVSEAYLTGLEKRMAAGHDIAVASVASFFISRVDVKVDPMLDKRDHESLKGKIGIANAKSVYARFQTVLASDRWQQLAEKGGRVQRLLWGSTSTKNPNYSDTLYVDDLIGPHTVNTVPPETLEAFLDHGKAAVTVNKQLDEAQQQLQQLATLGIDLRAVTETLQQEGVDKFIEPFDELIDSIRQKRDALMSEAV